MAETGCRTVVSSGHSMVAIGASSKPATDRRLGRSRPNFRAIEIAAAAMSSLLANIAVGGFAAPPRNSFAPVVSTLDPETAWKQLVARDRDARLVYGVTTTGIFCRPGCASRRPLRENVRFFQTAVEAQSAGFRACKRCRPTIVGVGTNSWSSPLDEIRGHIEKNLDRRVLLKELGRVAGLSPFTVQRLFKREMGVSPLQYQRAMRAGKLRGALKQGESVTDAIYSAGFGSSSRAYEGNQLGMTPARFAQGGKGEHISFTTARTVCPA